jgi:hypothetical protein
LQAAGPEKEKAAIGPAPHGLMDKIEGPVGQGKRPELRNNLWPAKRTPMTKINQDNFIVRETAKEVG